MRTHNRSGINFPATNRTGPVVLEPGLDTFGSDDMAARKFDRSVLVPKIVYAVLFET